MPAEIERKFLVLDDSWRNGNAGVRIAQGYLSTDVERTVRVRIAGNVAWLTIKGRSVGIRRAEYEYGIPLGEAQDLLSICLPGIIDKTRHRIPFAEQVWEVDLFHGENEGLVIAEVELANEEIFPELPSWVGVEVSGDPRYYNSNLAARPFRAW